MYKVAIVGDGRPSPIHKLIINALKENIMLKCSICGKTYATAKERAQCEMKCTALQEQAEERAKHEERFKAQEGVCKAYAEFVRVRNNYALKYQPTRISTTRLYTGDTRISFEHRDSIASIIVSESWVGEGNKDDEKMFIPE